MRRIAIGIIKLEWLILLLILALLLFPARGNGLLLLIIPILWIIRRIVFGRFVPATPINTSLFFLLTALLISLAAVFDINLSFPKIAGLLVGIALFFAAVQFSHLFNNGKWYLLTFIILAGTLMGIVGFMTSPFFTSLAAALSFPSIVTQPLQPIIKLADGQVNPNEIAGILSWIIPLLFAIIFGMWRTMWGAGKWFLKVAPFLLLLLLCLDLYLLIITQSRGAMAGVLIALLVMVILRYPRGRWLVIIGILGLVVLLIISGSLRFELVSLLFGDVESLTNLGLENRLEIWSRALYGIEDFPITGMSMNGFRKVVFILYPLFTVSPNFNIGHAHNQLLQAGLDLGLPGLIAYLSIWILCPVLLWIAWRKATQGANRALIIGLSGSLLAAWTFGILDAIALGARPGFLWWLIIGLVITVYRETLGILPAES